MKATQTCPKCAGRQFAVTPEFRQPDQRYSNSSCALPAITISHAKGKPDAASSGGLASTGRFETWICMKCGYTEFYAYDFFPEEMEAKWPDRVRIVDAGPPAKKPPYR